MKDHILEVLNRIELEFDVKILFACDAGSRALGFASPDSDYDIRFIYIHKLEWYLSIDEKRDVLEVPKHDSLSIQIDPKLDVSGWELKKALRLFRKSNPSLLEWIQSKEIYYQDFSTIEKMKMMEDDLFSAKPFIIHHLHIAKKNFDKEHNLKKRNIKLYLYILRSILAGKWIIQSDSVPPAGFQALLDILHTNPVKEATQKLLMAKQSGEELPDDFDMAVLDDFIIKEMELLESYAKQLSKKSDNPTELLNTLFRETLKEVWG
jgi:uncharacterized protein